MKDDLKPGDKVSVIPMDAVVQLPISGAFYSRIQQCFYALMESKIKEDPTGESTNAILKELETREPADLWETLVTVQLALLFAAEESAKEQGILIKKEALDFVPPTEASPEVSPES